MGLAMPWSPFNISSRFTTLKSLSSLGEGGKDRRWSTKRDKSHDSVELRTLIGVSPRLSRRCCQLNSEGSQSWIIKYQQPCHYHNHSCQEKVKSNTKKWITKYQEQKMLRKTTLTLPQLRGSENNIPLLTFVTITGSPFWTTFCSMKIRRLGSLNSTFGAHTKLEPGLSTRSRIVSDTNIVKWSVSTRTCYAGMQGDLKCC